MSIQDFPFFMFKRLSRYSVGVGVYHRESVQEEFLISDTPECRPKGLDFGIERLSRSI